MKSTSQKFQKYDEAISDAKAKHNMLSSFQFTKKTAKNHNNLQNNIILVKTLCNLFIYLLQLFITIVLTLPQINAHTCSYHVSYFL